MGRGIKREREMRGEVKREEGMEEENIGRNGNEWGGGERIMADITMNAKRKRGPRVSETDRKGH